MNAQKFEILLSKLSACQEAKDWSKNKSWQEVFNTCPRGDWLLWLYKRTNKGDLRAFTLAKGHCANTVRHLMKDERSIKAVDAAIAFGNGRINEKELAVAYAVAYAAYVDYVDYFTYVAYVAADTAADAADTCDAYYVAARKANQLLIADICRKYLPISLWNIK